jgi:hypothetical protein
MATEAEAHRAREQHSDYLRDLGAHAIAVDKIKRGGEDTFGVIAYYEKKPSDSVPDSLEIEHNGKKKKVPLTMRIAPMATLE